MLEKSGINKFNVIKRTRDIKMIKIKRSICVFLSVISSIVFAYTTCLIMRLDFSVMHWVSGERFVFLLLSFLSTFAIFYYCSNHILPIQNFRDESIVIKFLSSNWLKKLASIYVYYVSVVFIFYAVFCFCSMSFDVSKTDYVYRAIFSFVIYIVTLVLCIQTHNNNFKTILKIDVQ